MKFETEVVKGLLIECMRDLPEGVASRIARKIHSILVEELAAAGKLNNGTQASTITYAASAICSFLLLEIKGEDRKFYAEAMESLFSSGVQLAITEGDKFKAQMAEKQEGEGEWEAFLGGEEDV